MSDRPCPNCGAGCVACFDAGRSYADLPMRLLAEVTDQLEWAHDIIQGPHDICEMCEATVAARSILPQPTSPDTSVDREETE